MRRKRRNRQTWLPINPTIFGESYGTTFYSFIESVGEGIESGYGPPPTAIPILLDQTPVNDGSSVDQVWMRDYVEGQDYFLRRVVGKINISARQSSTAYTGPFIVCVGFAILPVSDQNQDQPDMDVDDYDPLNAANAQQPWFWRRTWILQNTFAPDGQFANGAQANWQYGSVMDGPHCDAKTMRRVTKEQRAFIVLSIKYAGDGETLTTQDFNCIFDLRALGSMRKSKNRSTFR